MATATKKTQIEVEYQLIRGTIFGFARKTIGGFPKSKQEAVSFTIARQILYQNQTGDPQLYPPSKVMNAIPPCEELAKLPEWAVPIVFRSLADYIKKGDYSIPFINTMGS